MAAQTKEFGEKLKQRRIELGLSRVELAAAIGVTSQCVYFIEEGLRFPRYNILIRLGEVLKFTIDYSAIVQFEEEK